MLSMISGIFAQNVDDALRYSQIFYSGTARFMSMGGAFTALGGDISSLSQNPAGLGVFRSSEITLTPQLFHINTTAGFKNKNSEDYIYNFNLAQAGIVSNLISKNSESGLLSLNFGYAFNKTNNLNQSIIIQGTGNNSSMTDYWASLAKGYYKDELIDFVPAADLAWYYGLIDTLPGSGTSYGTVYSNYGEEPASVYGQNIKRLVSYEGYTGEHALSIGGNYSNKFFFGATLAITALNYNSHYQHLESTDEVLPSKFTDFNYTFNYNNTGTGYGLKIGTIYRPNDMVRIGLAFHSPTLFRINEVVQDNITTYFSSSAVPYESANDPVRFNYALTTPFRFMAGVAVQLKKLALLSADYEFIDYSTARFSETGDDYDYTIKNQTIKSSLNTVSNLRLGAELRVSNLYLRGGYALYGKAWKENDINDNLNYNSISLGAGFREQNVSVDFGYTRMTNPHRYILYEYNTGPTSFISEVSDMSINKNIFAVTFGYKFGY